VDISAAFLCDFAEVREGLLMAVGGGVTRLWRDQYPASIGASLALLIDLPASDLDVKHEITAAIQGPDQPVGELKVEFQTGGGPDLQAGESAVAPLAIDLRPVQFPGPGSYSINITIDGAFVRAVGFVAQHPAARST
jgi:hypothetical protein